MSRARIELHVCQDCMLYEETGEFDDGDGPDRHRLREIRRGWAALRLQGMVTNDDSDEPTYVCNDCDHVGPPDFFETDDPDDDEAGVCPQCHSTDTQLRESGTNEFSARACSCCDSTLAGSRHRYALFPSPQVTNLNGEHYADS